MNREDIFKGNTFIYQGLDHKIIEVTSDTVTIEILEGVFKGEKQTLTKNSLLYSMNRT